jgi:hypothetical protein
MQLKTQKGFYILHKWMIFFFYKEMPLFKDKDTYILYIIFVYKKKLLLECQQNSFHYFLKNIFLLKI